MVAAARGSGLLPGDVFVRDSAQPHARRRPRPRRVAAASRAPRSNAPTRPSRTPATRAKSDLRAAGQGTLFITSLDAPEDRVHGGPRPAETRRDRRGVHPRAVRALRVHRGRPRGRPRDAPDRRVRRPPRAPLPEPPRARRAAGPPQSSSIRAVRAKPSDGDVGRVRGPPGRQPRGPPQELRAGRRRGAPVQDVGGERVLQAVRYRRGRALHDRNASAQRHRSAAHGTRDVRHASGHHGAQRAHARPSHAVAPGHRPRRHRDAAGGGEVARGGWADARGRGPRGIRAKDLGVEEGVRRAHR